MVAVLPGARPRRRSVRRGEQRDHGGQTVCIVEAMKLMNEIESEVEAASPDTRRKRSAVEYGQTLFLVESDTAA